MNLKVTRRSQRWRSQSTNSSPSSRKSTEPSGQHSTLAFRVGTFLLENWNMCGLKLSRNQSFPSAVTNDTLLHPPATVLARVPSPLPRHISSRPFESPIPSRHWAHVPSSSPLGCLKLVLLFFISFQNGSPPPHHHHHLPFYPGVKQW